MNSASAPRIIRRRPEHDAEIFALYAEIFGADMLERSRARWRWQYLDNPYTAADGPVIWMAMDDDRLLGQMATMPFPMWWGDREVRARASSSPSWAEARSVPSTAAQAAAVAVNAMRRN